MAQWFSAILVIMYIRPYLFNNKVIWVESKSGGLNRDLLPVICDDLSQNIPIRKHHNEHSAGHTEASKQQNTPSYG